MQDLKKFRKNKIQKGRINRKLKKHIGNHGRNAKKKRKRKNQKGGDGINIRLGNANQNIRATDRNFKFDFFIQEHMFCH